MPLRRASWMFPSTNAAIAAVRRCSSRPPRGWVARVALKVLLFSVLGCGRYRFEVDSNPDGSVSSQRHVARFEGYLAHRWGIPLDSAHPYAEKFTVVVIDAP